MGVVVKLGEKRLVDQEKEELEPGLEVKNGKAVLKFGNGLSVELDEETFRKLLGMGLIHYTDLQEEKVLYALWDFCEWAGKDVFGYIWEAVVTNLKGDLEVISAQGIPKADEFLERLKQASLS